MAELLSWPEVDGCIVCTPNDTHVELGLAVARAGRHLLMEKPLAITLAGADALVRAFADRQLVLMGAIGARGYLTPAARVAMSCITACICSIWPRGG